MNNLKFLYPEQKKIAKKLIKEVESWIKGLESSRKTNHWCGTWRLTCRHKIELLNIEIQKLIDNNFNKMINEHHSIRYKYQNLLKNLIQCSIKIHKLLTVDD